MPSNGARSAAFDIPYISRAASPFTPGRHRLCVDGQQAGDPDKLAQARPTTKAQPLDPYAATPAVDPAAAYKTGLQQYARGDTAGALATFKGSLSSNPGFAPTWRGIGLVYEKIGNKGQARTAFKRYLQLAPDAGDADQIRDRMERLGP
jgi:tetratricopeptide (TPR) repeat protein